MVMVPPLLAVARMATAAATMRAAGFGAVSPWLQSAGRGDEV
jgi:hypothetical protein